MLSRSEALVIRQWAFQNGRRGRLSLAKQYMDLVSRGVPPAIVLQSRAGDKAISRAEIEELIEAAVR